MSGSNQIISYLRTTLATIRDSARIDLPGGKSYTIRTDAGRLVDLNLEFSEHPDDMPALAFYIGKKTSGFDTEPLPELGMENHVLEISIEGFIQSDKGGTEGEDLKLDIATVLKAADPYWGDRIIKLDNYAAESEVQIGDEVYTIVRVSFSAMYTAPYGTE